MRNNEFEENEEKLMALVEQYQFARENNEPIHFSEEDFEEIIHYFLQSNKASEALEASEFALNIFPYSSEFSLAKADAYLELGDLENAEETLDNNYTLDYSDVNFYLIKSEIFLQRNQFDEALDTIKKGLKNCFEDKDSLYLQMADIYEEMGDYHNMILSVKKALKINPKNEEAFVTISFAFQFHQSTSDKISIFSELIDEDPYNVLAWYHLYLAYRESKKMDKAIEALEYILAIEPENEECINNLAITYYENNDYEKALNFLLELEKTDGLSAYNYIIMGVCYRELKQYKKAKVCFKEAMAIDDENPDLYFHLALMYFEEKKYNAAYSLIQKAVSYSKSNVYFLELKANIMLGMDMLEESIEVLKTMIKIDPEMYLAYAKLSLALYINGQSKEALELIKEAIETYNYGELYFYQSIIYFEEGKMDAGLMSFMMGMEFSPQSYQIVFDYTPWIADLKSIQDVLIHYQSKNNEK